MYGTKEQFLSLTNIRNILKPAGQDGGTPYAMLNRQSNSLIVSKIWEGIQRQ